MSDSDSNQETKGVYAKTSGEAADRGRRLGLTGDLNVSQHKDVTGNDGEVKTWKVTGEPAEEVKDV